MMGLDHGILGTLIGGAVMVGIVYTILKNSSGIAKISGDKGGALSNLGKISRVAQGA